jgi:hypothetical protein
MQKEFDNDMPIYVHSVPITTPDEIGFLLSILFDRKIIQDDRLYNKHGTSMFAPSDAIVRYLMIHDKGSHQQSVVVICNNSLTIDHPNVVNFSDIKGQKIEYTF